MNTQFSPENRFSSIELMFISILLRQLSVKSSLEDSGIIFGIIFSKTVRMESRATSYISVG